jgi:hypothetical protein
MKLTFQKECETGPRTLFRLLSVTRRKMRQHAHETRYKIALNDKEKHVEMSEEDKHIAVSRLKKQEHKYTLSSAWEIPAYISR